MVHGYPYMQIEFGWTEVIAGSVALSGGIVTIAIGAVLLSLAALRGAVERSGIAAPRDLAPLLPVRSADPDVARPPHPAVVTEKRNPTPSPDETPAERSRTAAPERPASEKPAPRPSRPAAVEPPVIETPAAPTLVGRYESSGSSYVLFSDGTIEVESKTGKRRFGSMDELKAFMGREEAEPPRAILSS